ncbi:MAG: acyl-CoA synthetase FdrA [Pseudomonadota bacterium]
MSEVVVSEVRRDHYVDSVALMRLSQSLMNIEGVQEAALMMGTAANLALMEDARLLDETGRHANGGDLVVGVRAENQEAATAALLEAKNLLGSSKRNDDAEAKWRPKSVRAAVNGMPDANLALISVSGEFAATEARKAIRRGLHAMIFSDNVSLADEVAIKREALDAGVLAMGPDCGTAILNGVPLAFANVVRQGTVGIVGASGTGIQEVTCLIDHLGGGVSHAIGVGGRDLSHDVGGISTLMALDLLDEDAETEHVVIISKPPPVDVASRILDRVSRSNKSFTVCFIGSPSLNMPSSATQAFTLESAAEIAVGRELAVGKELAGISADGAWHTLRSATGNIVQGLFSGGTLCSEAQVTFAEAGQPIQSNVLLPSLADGRSVAGAHVMLDLGEDEYTRGRPHPMIDPTVRSPVLREALQLPQTAVVLLDIVIGFGSAADPAGEVTSVLRDVVKRDRPAVVASVTGTDSDPQSRVAQMSKLQAEGVHVARSNAQAARLALEVLAAK